MATLTSSLVVRLIDQVTAPARKISASLLGLNNAAGGNFGQRLGAAIERNNAALDAARGRLFDAAAGFYALKTAIASPVRAAMEFESAMADVRKVVDFPTPEAFEAFKDDLIALSKQVPVSVNGLSQIAAAAGQAGIAREDIIKFTEAAAKVGVAFDISADQAGDAVAKLMTGLGYTLDEAILLTDAMNHLSNAQASGADEILDFVRRTGSMAKGFGVSAEQAAAFGSAMISAGAKVEVASTSFQNMGAALVSGAAATADQRKAFKRLGLDARKVAKAMQVDADGTIISVLERINELPADVRQATIFQLFGKNADAILPLVNNMDLLRESLGLVDDETKYAGSSFREFGVRAETFENAVQTFKNRIEALKIVIGAALIPALNQIMEAISPVIDKVTEFAQAHPDLTRNALAAAAALVAVKIASAGLTFIGLLGKGGALSLLSIGFKTVGKAALGARAAIAGELGLQAALAGGMKYGGMAKVADAAKALARATPGLNLVGPAISAITTALGGLSLPVTLGIAAVAGAGVLIWKYWDRISSIFSGVGRAISEQLAPAFENPVFQAHIKNLADMGSAIATGWEQAKTKVSEFATWIGSFFQREILTEEQKAGFEQAGYDVATKMIEAVKAKIGELVEWFKSLPGKIIEAIGNIDLSQIIKWPSPPAWWTNRPAWMGGTGGSTTPEPTGRPNPMSGHKATGGPVWRGGSFLVGENEPEIFTPSTGGHITPLSKLGGGGLTIEKIEVNGATDPEETARRVIAQIKGELGMMMRGAHADMGAR